MCDPKWLDLRLRVLIGFTVSWPVFHLGTWSDLLCLIWDYKCLTCDPGACSLSQGPDLWYRGLLFDPGSWRVIQGLALRPRVLTCDPRACRWPKVLTCYPAPCSLSQGPDMWIQVFALWPRFLTACDPGAWSVSQWYCLLPPIACIASSLWLYTVKRAQGMQFLQCISDHDCTTIASKPK